MPVTHYTRGYQHSIRAAMKSSFNYTTATDQRVPQLLPQWSAVYTLLLLWALAQLLKYVIVAAKHLFPRVMGGRRAYGPIGAGEEGSGISKYGATGAPPTPGAEGLARGGAGLGRGGASTSAATGEEEIETALAGGGPVSGREEEDLMGPYSAWTTRLEHASDALRTNLLLLLAASTLISLPIEYNCTTMYRHLENDYSRLGMSCGSCIANSTSNFTTILTWLFVAATMIWALLELFVSNPQSSSATRCALILVAQPLMVVVFIMAFARWSYLKGLMCSDKTLSTSTFTHYEEPTATKLDMYDLLVHGVNLL
ncbi:hypothetical protein SeMB42_g05537 [Synchytrium endobioticum]|uniref:Uncharacterized protein n=1 Tax=Synchytrium endobioticum TaxID=286115 RepID=A0A507DAB7_9FUNG|nr:hypothetical protein SeMB42_g05537 [Synchytrium endobioticum]TPX47758.1 hypothetical protein SeLEV6574_g02459 [Synchytrium endobioticum]